MSVVAKEVVEQLRTLMSLDETLAASPSAQESTLAAAMGATLAPDMQAGGTANDRVSALLARAIEKQQERLVLGETLGEGGMGVVRNARQSDLGRDVAVKTLRQEKATQEAMLAMLREAWVTGTLEHPNIIPVYYLDSSDDGVPLIVLKRIEGEVWSGLMGNAQAVEERFGTTDLLAWNLAVLAKIVNALRYAHRRGVIHCDLKPDNVMVGEFGEVYVVDWGIAVSLVDDGETLLPIASNAPRIAGTPAYMAPEMLGECVDQRTDVYLLGAMLYQIVADRPPHIGVSLMDFVVSIERSNPSFPSGIATELKEICSKAMSIAPADRYQDAGEFGHALQEFLAHRGALQLCRRAQIHLATMTARIAEHASSDEIMELLGECRFGFQSSLEAWPENEEAKAGLKQAIEKVADFELKGGDPKVAASILRELESPTELLATKVACAVEALELADQRMARIDEQLDRGVGTRTRVYLLALFGSLWIAIDLWVQWTGNIERIASHQTMLVGSLLSIAVLGLVIYKVRLTLMRTVINRQLGGALFALLATQSLVSAVSPSIGIAPAQAQIMWMLIWTSMATTISLTIEKRMWPMALTAALCFVAASVWMPYRLYAMVVVTASMVVNAGVLWWPKASKAP